MAPSKNPPWQRRVCICNHSKKGLSLTLVKEGKEERGESDR